MKTGSISRRDFLNRTAAGTAALALTPVNSLLAHPAAAKWPKDAGKYSIYLIGHGHIDPVWLWPWTEGISVVHSTFRSALDRMKETPGVVFTASSAQFYQWVADNDPAMLAEIRQRIDEGVWNVVGGWWVEPDMNLPSGEAMARQGLYGQLTLQKLVGRRAVVAFNPDSFGHPGTLPQIIRQQGMENYVFMRPEKHEKDLPANLFWWEGPDGTRVMTYRIQDGYNAGGNEEEMRRRVSNFIEYARAHPVPMIMLYYGHGDHGGGPTKINIRALNSIMQDRDAPNLFYGNVDYYFREARAIPNLSLPVVKDDLQHHARGCYSAESEIKKNNRLSEAALVTAEKITAVGSLLWDAAYPKTDFTKAWKQVLFLQFHDSLAGSSVAEHSRDAREGHNYALNIAHSATALAIQKLEWRIPAEDPDSQYLVAFNPHAWEVKGVFEYTQYQSHAGKMAILFHTSLPPTGYRQIRNRKGDSEPATTVSAENNSMENEFYRITFSPDGQIGIFDREAGREVFAGGATGCRGVVIDDPSDTWSHEVRDFTQNTQGPYRYTTKGEIGAFGRAEFTTLENGPLRAVIRVRSSYGDNSTLTVDWMLTAASRRIEARVSLNWNEQLRMLKFSFPVDVAAPEATYEIPYGFIVRPTNGEEEAGQRWIDVTGKRDAGSYGLTVFNDAKYGYSIRESDMRVTVTRSAPFAYHGPSTLAEITRGAEAVWQDQGIQTFRLLLVPHKGDWKAVNAPRIAEEFLTPPVVIYQGIHGGTMLKSAAYLSVDEPNVTVSAIKKSETDEDLIIRLVETQGREASPTLTFPSAGFSWRGKLGACEIKTLRLHLATGDIREVNLLEE
jgi:alpha-mannosidase